MGDFQRKPQYDFAYTSCIYSGISRAIEFEIKNGQSDHRKELAYVVARYCKEQIVSGAYLREQLEEYNKIASERYGAIEKENEGEVIESANIPPNETPEHLQSV